MVLFDCTRLPSKGFNVAFIKDTPSSSHIPQKGIGGMEAIQSKRPAAHHSCFLHTNSTTLVAVTPRQMNKGVIDVDGSVQGGNKKTYPLRHYTVKHPISLCVSIFFVPSSTIVVFVTVLQIAFSCLSVAASFSNSLAFSFLVAKLRCLCRCPHQNV